MDNQAAVRCSVNAVSGGSVTHPTGCVRGTGAVPSHRLPLAAVAVAVTAVSVSNRGPLPPPADGTISVHVHKREPLPSLSGDLTAAVVSEARETGVSAFRETAPVASQPPEASARNRLGASATVSVSGRNRTGCVLTVQNVRVNRAVFVSDIMRLMPLFRTGGAA